ncbi:MAG: three-Cys-motif partner protein TcmP [bacterium]
MTGKYTTPEIPPHTRKKHELLQRYLSCWFPIVFSRAKRGIYVDSFSFSGRYSDGTPGSPLIALQTAIESKIKEDRIVDFFFSDSQLDNTVHLKSEIDALDKPKHLQVQIENTNSSNCIARALAKLRRVQGEWCPTFVFIDPYGYKDVRYDQIAEILKYNGTEAFVTFMVDRINQFLTFDNEKNQNHLREYFGTEEVFEVAKQSENRIHELRLLYQRQLQKLAKHVQYFEMINKNGRTIYYLFFASNHALGNTKMKEAMWTVDRTGNFLFSDKTDPNTTFLFSPDDIAIDNLSELYLQHFDGMHDVSTDIIFKFTNENTKYIERHGRLALIKLEAEQNIEVAEYKKDGSRRRKGSFPKGLSMNFKNIRRT